jgi:hypothetical protein
MNEELKRVRNERMGFGATPHIRTVKNEQQMSLITTEWTRRHGLQIRVSGGTVINEQKMSLIQTERNKGHGL